MRFGLYSSQKPAPDSFPSLRRCSLLGMFLFFERTLDPRLAGRQRHHLREAELGGHGGGGGRRDHRQRLGQQLQRGDVRVVVQPLPPHRPPDTREVYSDQKVANREIRVWHFVIENGY